MQLSLSKIYFIIVFIFSQSKDISGETSTELVLVSHCPYRMAIKAKEQRGGETPWSEEKYFGMVIKFQNKLPSSSKPQCFRFGKLLVLLPSSGCFKNDTDRNAFYPLKVFF